MRRIDDLSDWIDRSEDIRYSRQCHEFRTPTEQSVQRLDVQLKVVPYAEPANDRPGSLGELLPWHDIRVMLHLRKEYLIARPQIRIAPTAGYQVDRSGRARSENHLLRRVGLDPTGEHFSRLLHGLGGLGGQLMTAAMHVGIMRAIHAIHGIEDRRRALR